MILRWPLPPEHRRVTQAFGENPADYAAYGLAGHEGTDLSCQVGTPVMAAHAGTVQLLYSPHTYGIHLQLWADDVMTLYAHLSGVGVTSGHQVAAGKLIAFSGNTGRSTGPHLHFGVCPLPRDMGNGYKGWVNPLPLLQEGERMEAARAEATAVRFEIEQIVRLREEAKQHHDNTITERAMEERCLRQADMREQALISTRNGKAYRVEGLLGGPLPKDWEG